MQKIRFEEAVKIIRERDRRFDADAYLFLRDALDYTVKKLRSDEIEEHRHVTGPELLNGAKDYALKEYGPMALTVLESWGIQSGNDIGEMVFQLIKVGAFGQSPDDSPDDFMDAIDLEKELSKPYRPKNAANLPVPTRQNQPATSSEA